MSERHGDGFCRASGRKTLVLFSLFRRVLTAGSHAIEMARERMPTDTFLQRFWFSTRCYKPGPRGGALDDGETFYEGI